MQGDRGGAIMWICPRDKEHFQFVRNGLFHLVVGPDGEEIFVCPPTYADMNDYTGAYCHICGAEAEETTTAYRSVEDWFYYMGYCPK